ncbi:MAG: hypothetical protein WB713_06255 [Methyloceanibacter sp.]
MPGLLFVSASVGALSYQGVAAYHTSNAETVLILLGWSSGGDQHLHYFPHREPRCISTWTQSGEIAHIVCGRCRVIIITKDFAVGEHHSSVSVPNLFGKRNEAMHISVMR